MTVESIAEAIRSLTPEQQHSVQVFIAYLQGKQPEPSTPFLRAVDDFIEQHPELLRRLAQ